MTFLRYYKFETHKDWLRIQWWWYLYLCFLFIRSSNSLAQNYTGPYYDGRTEEMKSKMINNKIFRCNWWTMLITWYPLSCVLSGSQWSKLVCWSNIYHKSPDLSSHLHIHCTATLDCSQKYKWRRGSWTNIDKFVLRILSWWLPWSLSRSLYFLSPFSLH